VAKVQVEIENYGIPVFAGGVPPVPIDTETMEFGVGGLLEYWVNKTWDPGGPEWVYWETNPDPDVGGASYPDPHGTGFGGTEGYRIAARRYR